MNSKQYIPWVEKYRPTDFNSIVLDKDNKCLLNNILKKNYLPNLLLYGPPGTGKTTTIINLITSFQFQNNQLNKGLMIHLNASDERGIDIIRNQINTFVNSDNLFTKGLKFVILDEVDYMTKNAQLALKNLLNEYKKNVRFCLICNYISKIEESLQNDFLRLRFNQLPKNEIIDFLEKINKNEKLNLKKHQLISIQQHFSSDIRSMINYMQSNILTIKNTIVINEYIFDKIILISREKSLKIFVKEFQELSIMHNIDIKNIIKDFINYILRFKLKNISQQFLKNLEYLIHFPESNSIIQIKFIYYLLKSSLKEL